MTMLKIFGHATSAFLLFGLISMNTTSAAGFERLAHPKTECTACHEGIPAPGTSVKIPNTKCEACHGSMEKIQLPKNPFGKDAHRSPHYADLVNCTTCHGEHTRKESLCVDCHVVK